MAELVGADVRVLSSISPQRGVHPAHLPHARAPTRPGKEAQPTNKLWGLPAENDISTRAWGHQANGSLDGSDRAGSSRGAKHSQIRHLLPRLKARSQSAVSSALGMLAAASLSILRPRRY